MVDVCKNGATCLDFAGGYNCTCLPGFKGEHCDIGQLQLKANLKAYYISQKKILYSYLQRNDYMMFKEIMTCLNLFNDRNHIYKEIIVMIKMIMTYVYLIKD